MRAGIPDNLSLRLRALTNCPAIAILAALFLVDRRQRRGLQILQGRRQSTVMLHEQSLGSVLSVLTDFSRAMGWTLSRPPDGHGLHDHDLLDVAADLGMLSQVGPRRVLAESLFVRLQEDPESRDCYDRLLPLERMLSEWLDTRQSRQTLPD